MSSIRLVSLVGLFVLAFGSVACAAASPEQDGAGAGFGSLAGKKGGTRTAGGADAPGGASGTCDGACAHYLGCKGADTADNRAACTEQCRSLGIGSEELAAFEQTDCATAIATIEGSGGGSSGGSSSGGSSSGGAKSSECDGCVSDGSSCVWLSQSDWGSGAYSGAAAECASYCCQ